MRRGPSAKFKARRRNIVLCRPSADPQPMRDLLWSLADGEPAQHLDFARGQPQRDVHSRKLVLAATIATAHPYWGRYPIHIGDSNKGSAR